MENQDRKPLRILLATPYKGIGGLSQWARNILDYYAAQKTCGVEIDLLPMGRKSPVDMNKKWRRMWRGVADYSEIVREEKRMMREKQYDVLHLCTSASMSLFKDLVMLEVAKRHRVHTLVHFHFGRIPTLSEQRGWEWKMLQRVIKMADAVVPIDQKSYDALAPRWKEKVCLLPNPVGLVISNYIQAHENTIQRDERLLLYAGHCIKTKGIIELVNACKQIEGVRLVLAGRVSDDMRQQLSELANGEPWLEIRGVLPHETTLGLMLQCGVFVLPSYTEGFPNVILESMACGCAIVATDVGEIPEMLGGSDGQTYGLMVKPKDVTALKDALCRMLDDQNLRDNCRQNVRERVNERYNMASVWQKMLDLWWRCAKG